MARTLRPQEQAWSTISRWLAVMLCALATLLSVTLSGCASVSPFGNFTSKLPAGCAPSGDAPLIAPGYDLPTTPTLVANGVVYVGYALADSLSNGAGVDYYRNYADRFALAALRASDGTTLWSVPTSRGRSPYTVTGAWPLAVANGVLVVYDTAATIDGLAGLMGLRASDGATLWRTALSYHTMTARDGVIYVTAGEGIAAVRIADGRLLWQTTLRGGFFSAPLIVGASLYVANTYGSVVALRTDTGAIRWTSLVDPAQPPFGQYLPLGMSDGWLYVYAPSDEAHGVASGVLRLNPTSGASQGYALRLPTSTEALNPMLQADVFYSVVSSFGPTTSVVPPTVTAYRLSATGSQLLWRTPMRQHPAYLAGYDAQALYLKPEDRPWTIFSFDLSDGVLLWQKSALPTARTGITVDAGKLFETLNGLVTPCHTPPIDQAAEIRAYSTADGSVLWTRNLDARL